MYPFSIFTLFSKSIFPVNYIFLNLYNLVSKCAVFTPSKSQPKKTEDLSERSVWQRKNQNYTKRHYTTIFFANKFAVGGKFSGVK